MQRRFKSLLAEFLANAFNRKDLHAQVLSNLGVLVVGSVRVCLEQDAGSSDGLGWVFACSGEAGQELALFVGQGYEVSFHLVSVIQFALTNNKRVTIH